MSKEVQIEFAGQSMRLLGERALLWQKTLIVADVHVGKAATFRLSGLPVPMQAGLDDLDRLGNLIETHAPDRLLILGDFLHAKAGRTPETLASLREFRDRCRLLPITLVRGNHDRHAGDPPAELDVETRSTFDEAGLQFCHEPPEQSPPLPTLCGHLHPAVRTRDFDGSGVTLPCFAFDERRRVLILPAFGKFTGTCRFDPTEGWRFFACAAGRVAECAAAGSGRRARTSSTSR
ncbi:MAG: ligase-associated DNA damage response endonuclease PdeM [Planctomycetota bacterium]